VEEPVAKPSRRKMAAGIGLALLIILLVASVSYYQLVLVPAELSQPTAPSVTTPALSPTPTPKPSPTPSSPTAIGVTFVLTVQDEKTPWAFMAGSEANPTLRAKVGDTITITLHNTGYAPHDLRIEGLDVHIPSVAAEETAGHEGKPHQVWPGEEVSVTFTADKAGTFTYYCTIPGHRELGMEGQIIVEQQPQQTTPTPSAPPTGNIVKVKMEVVDTETPWGFTVEGELNPEIRVNLGDTVEITLTNTGQAPHDITIPQFGVTAESTFVMPGETITVSFVADSQGTFEYFCSQPGHEQLGMKGVIVVE